MVNVGQKYNLNHVESIYVGSPEVLVGQHHAVGLELFELFQRSLALTSDLKRLPILRGINITDMIQRTIISELTTSGVSLFICTVSVFNDKMEIGEVPDVFTEEFFRAHHLLYQSQMILNRSASPATFNWEREAWPYKGGILLNHTITVVVTISTDANVGSAVISSGASQGIINLEIDWAPVSKKEFEDFILESVYARE